MTRCQPKTAAWLVMMIAWQTSGLLKIKMDLQAKHAHSIVLTIKQVEKR
jgi:hypothetical protein